MRYSSKRNWLSVVWILPACAGEAPPPAAPPSTPSPSASVEPEAPPPTSTGVTAKPAGKRAPCQLGADQQCNEDPSVSALWGRCTELGVCECKPGFELNPKGRCQKAQ
ncbi:MAG TPA: hypothetical protein VG937_24255 [Polyangiaceae bacterium]|nr:hypothetical protein [Polyangiaceae bacterium]